VGLSTAARIVLDDHERITRKPITDRLAAHVLSESRVGGGRVRWLWGDSAGQINGLPAHATLPQNGRRPILPPLFAVGCER
jgi:hypothetical protein